MFLGPQTGPLGQQEGLRRHLLGPLGPQVRDRGGPRSLTRNHGNLLLVLQGVSWRPWLGPCWARTVEDPLDSFSGRFPARMQLGSELPGFEARVPRFRPRLLLFGIRVRTLIP